MIAWVIKNNKNQYLDAYEEEWGPLNAATLYRRKGSIVNYFKLANPKHEKAVKVLIKEVK